MYHSQLCAIGLIWLSSALAQKELGDLDLGCPRGSYRFGNFCYSIIRLAANYDDAELICEGGGGILAAPKDNETYLFIQKLRIRKFLHNYWIGLNDRQKEGQWVFSDGSRVNGFKKWFPGEPNNAQGQHCGMMWMLKNLLWDDDYCNKKYGYICQFEGAKCNSTASRFGNYCYELSTELSTYDEAEAKCNTKKGVLAAVKTQGLHDALKMMIYAERGWTEMDDKKVLKILRENDGKLSTSWIGLRYVNGGWIYSDGTPLSSFTKWAPGEPNNIKNNEDCIMTGQNWFDVQCDNVRSFICQYPVENKTPETNVSQVQCSDRDEKPKEKDEPIITEVKEMTVTTVQTTLSKLKDVPSPVTQNINEEVSEIVFTKSEFIFILIGVFILGMVCSGAILAVNRYKERIFRRGEKLEDDQVLAIIEHDTIQFHNGKI